MESNSKARATTLTNLLGIELPIIQGPFGGFQTQQLAAKVSNNGGLGSFGALSVLPGDIGSIVDEIRTLTSRPFSINLWVSVEDEGARTSTEDDFNRSAPFIAPYIESLGGQRPTYKPYHPVSFEDQAQALLDARPPVFSFLYGIPSPEILSQCRAKGIKTLGTATTVDEAVALESAGVDVIVASGFEAGGHRGSFLRPAEESLTGTFALVPQVADAVRIPVIAAGGIADARGVAAAFALGASGVQVGTAFLACNESGASEAHRQLLLSGNAGRTGLTKSFTGRLGRGIRNRLMTELDTPEVKILPYPLQRHLVRNLTDAAEAAGSTDLLPLWSGQSANLTHCHDAAILLGELAKGLL